MAKRTKRIWLLPALCLLLGLVLWLLLPGRGERGGVAELLSAPRNLAGEPERATRRERRIVTAYRGVPESLAELENYLPEQYLVVKQARLLRMENCVILLVSPQAEELARLFA